MNTPPAAAGMHREVGPFPQIRSTEIDRLGVFTPTLRNQMWNPRGCVPPRQGLAGAGPLASVAQAAGQELHALHPETEATSLHPSSFAVRPQQRHLPGQGPWGVPSQSRAFLEEEQAGGRVDMEHAGPHAPPLGILWFLGVYDLWS